MKDEREELEHIIEEMPDSPLAKMPMNSFMYRLVELMHEYWPESKSEMIQVITALTTVLGGILFTASRENIRQLIDSTCRELHRQADRVINDPNYEDLFEKISKIGKKA